MICEKPGLQNVDKKVTKIKFSKKQWSHGLYASSCSICHV